MNRSQESTNRRELLELRNTLSDSNMVGGFSPQDALVVRKKLSKPENQPEELLEDALLLELHALAAAVHDQTGEYDIARSFLDRWARAIQSEAASFLRRGKETKMEIPLHPKEKAHFLLQAGVGEYRVSKFGAARAYLKDANGLYGEVLKKQGLPLLSKLAITNMRSLCCYWLGCVETYANKFHKAEECFVEGLKHAAEASSGALPDQQARFAKYNTGRLLLGLGLLHYHKGTLVPANANLLAAKIFLQRDSQDRARQLRADMLLLSVQRMEYAGAPNKEHEFRDLIEKLKVLAKELKGFHNRYFVRAQSTIARVQVDLADLYKARAEQPDTKESDRAAALRQAEEALKAAKKIFEEQHIQAYASDIDKLQLDVVKLRTLRRLGEYNEAIEWGENAILWPETHDHSLLYTEILFALGHAYYDRWKKAAGKTDLENAKKYITLAGDEGEKNPRAKAVCCLHLARIAHAQGFKGEMQKQLNEWEKISEMIKLEWIKRFAQKVQKEIRSDDSIVFSLEELPDKNIYPIFEARLKEFLLKRVVSEMPIEDALLKLGISKQTYYNWQEQKPDRRRERKPRKQRTEKSDDMGSDGSPI